MIFHGAKIIFTQNPIKFNYILLDYIFNANSSSQLQETFELMFYKTILRKTPM